MKKPIFILQYFPYKFKLFSEIFLTVFSVLPAVKQ